MIDPVFWTMGDRAIDPDPDWVASLALGGPDTASLRLRGIQARRAERDSVLKAWTDANVQPWEGKVDKDPLIRDGAADISGVGFKREAEKAFGRRLYQIRDVSLFGDRTDPPFSQANQSDDMRPEIDRVLAWLCAKGEAASTNEAHGVAIWTPGTPGGLTRVAWTWASNFAHASHRIQVYAFTGPDGAPTLDGDFGVASSGTEDFALSVPPEDGIVLLYRYTGGAATFGHSLVRLLDLRVNGIAPGDEFTTGEVVADIAQALGWDASGVQAGSVNALPLDIADGEAWMETLLYMAMLEDNALYLLPGKAMTFHPWGERRWETDQARRAHAELDRLETFDGTVVTYSDVAGPRQATSGATSGNIFRESLSDVQANDDLAQLLADSQFVYWGQPQYEGTTAMWDASLVGGAGSVRDLRPGDELTLTDFGDAQALTMRVHEVEMSRTQMVAKTNQASGLAERIVGLAGLEGSRAPGVAGAFPADPGGGEPHRKKRKKKRRRRRRRRNRR